VTVTASIDRTDALALDGPGVACSVGIMAYNEEANIADAIGAILGEKLSSSQIAELIVVASGCEDRTVPVVRELAGRDPRVRLIEQERREGKASAINLFIGAATAPVLLMVSADVLVESGTIDALLRHFEDPGVGMVGGHPIPVNGETTFLGHAVHLQWRLHDRIARESPKLGEIVAFRNVVPSIPNDTAVDEISIQALITQLGYRLVYEPEAIVYNRGPTTVRDWLRQRRRIHAGHLQIVEHQGYAASTMSSSRVVRALVGSGSFSGPRAAVWTIGTVGLEATARALGRYDVARRRPQHVWEMCPTTKLDVAEGSAPRQQNVLVFHIANFHRQELQLGAHASRQLTQRVRDHIRRAVGSKATVSIGRSGTLVALVDGDREAAERMAAELVGELEEKPLPLNGHGATVPINLACAIIAFPADGLPLAQPVLAVPMLEPEAAAAAAT
jgi:biofilm PGA synthesis N-glycosyltransferase PgaC